MFDYDLQESYKKVIDEFALITKAFISVKLIIEHQNEVGYLMYAFNFLENCSKNFKNSDLNLLSVASLKNYQNHISKALFNNHKNIYNRGENEQSRNHH